MRATGPQGWTLINSKLMLAAREIDAIGRYRNGARLFLVRLWLQNPNNPPNPAKAAIRGATMSCSSA